MFLSRTTVAFSLMVIGVVLQIVPASLADRWRIVVSDAVRPGRIALIELSSTLNESSSVFLSSTQRAASNELDRLRAERDEYEARSLALSAEVARLNEARKVDGQLPRPLRELPTLIVPSLVEATVLGDVVAEQWRSGLLLDQGRVNGVRESALVVKGRRQLIDIGEDAALSPEDTLLLGRSVIGKVERVGRWTSAILLLTDPRYRGSARLIHEGDAGFEFGAHGVLKGRGEATCRLEGIASTEKVCEGDGVYSMSRESGVDAPLYYGRVVKAVLEPGEKEWLVEVEPTSLPSELKTVQVLRSTVRPSRLEYAQRMTDE